MKKILLIKSISAAKMLFLNNLLYKKVYVIFLSFLFIFLLTNYSFAQYYKKDGDLLHLTINQVEINLKDTFGHWYNYETSDWRSTSGYLNIFKGGAQKYFLIGSSYSHEYMPFSNSSYTELQGASDSSLLTLSETGWDVIIEYYYLETYPFKVKKGTWLFDNITQHHAFLTNKDSLIFIDYNDNIRLTHVAGKIDSLFLCVAITYPYDIVFFLSDLSKSPNIDTTGAHWVRFNSQDDYPLRIQKIVDDIYFYQSFSWNDHLSIRKYVDSTFIALKSNSVHIHNTNRWIYKEPYLYVYFAKKIDMYVYSSQDSSVTFVKTLFEEISFVDEGFDYAVGIKNDTLFAVDIDSQVILNSWNVSAVDEPSNPLINYPDIYFHRIMSVTSLDKKLSLPEIIELQNYPNPFNPITIIRYSITNKSKVSLKIFDITGREIKTLADEWQPPGEHLVNFNAQNLASGIYIYRLQVGQLIKQKKMILLK